MADITISGLDKVLAKLGKLESMKLLEAPMERSLIKIEDKMKGYPSPPASGEWAANTDIRQKRAFFALLRAGRIVGRRTGTLGKRWTHVITRTHDGLEGRVGNNVPYAPWVKSKRFQARFHRGRWNTDQEVLESLRSEIVRDFKDTVKKAME